MIYLFGYTISFTLLGNICLVIGFISLVFFPALKQSKKSNDQKLIRDFRARLSALDGDGPFSDRK